MMKFLGSMLLILSVLGKFSPALADEEDMEELAALFPGGRNLLQLAYTRVDSAESETAIWLPNYTHAYSRNLRFSLTAGISTASDIVALQGTPEESDSFSGIADSQFLVQIDPSAKLTASPVIPDTVGFTFSVQIPTGNQDKGLGVDAWIGQIGAGWLVDVPWRFWLLPSVQYQRSFSEGSEVPETDRITGGVGLYWLFPIKAWLGLAPSIGYDYFAEETFGNFSVVAGKSWSSGWGVDISWDRLDRIDPGARRDDEQIFFNLSYQFGKPPRE